MQNASGTIEKNKQKPVLDSSMVRLFKYYHRVAVVFRKLKQTPVERAQASWRLKYHQENYRNPSVSCGWKPSW